MMKITNKIKTQITLPGNVVIPGGATVEVDEKTAQDQRFRQLVSRGTLVLESSEPEALQETEDEEEGDAEQDDSKRAGFFFRG